MLAVKYQLCHLSGTYQTHERFHENLVELCASVFGDAGESLVEGYSSVSDAALGVLHARLLQINNRHLHRAIQVLSHTEGNVGLREAITIAGKVADVVRSLEERDFTIDDVAAALQQSPAAVHHTSSTQNLVRQAVFAFVGCFTGIYTAHLDRKENVFLACQPQQDRDEATTCTHDNILIVDRPHLSMLKALGISIAEPCPEHKHDQISVAYVNAATLNTKIEGQQIKIEWVDNLRAHLEFNEDTRTLLLFRFLSMCALHMLQEPSRSMFDRLWDNYHINVETVTQKNAAFHHEVLLSYRVVFGQTKAARRLFHRREKRLAASPNGFIDPLLVTLCGSKTPLSDIMRAHGISERDGYETHFPCLAQHLLRVQRFVLSHKVTRVRDRWRDRANRAEWTAFWTFLLVGVLSIILSVVQIGLAAAQLGAQLQSNNQNTASKV
ncbi:hypothetical protein O1611_g8631 [Lasiodiplodia mahajangana]|uniref:Uncharacterized protein n=1 Tax=Lasiodiplodia mahajangana TaxID=1108764 RepID=A0ACC2JC67_9PEZI|nr:hypothetical protein O1611_g8631 [Lasiodiplodia mahajangana]